MTSRRNTIQKDLIRNTVYEMRRHVTANEVYEFIKEAYTSIGKGTVYRNLDILVEEGALRKVEVPNGPNRFDFTLKNHYHQFLLFFDNLYDRFTDMEKKIFMKSFLEEGNIYEAEQEDGRILRSLKFRFPVFFNEQELYELDWDNESTVESVLLMRRAKR